MSKEIAIKEEVNFDTMLMDIENMPIRSYGFIGIAYITN